MEPYAGCINQKNCQTKDDYVDITKFISDWGSILFQYKIFSGKCFPYFPISQMGCTFLKWKSFFKSLHLSTDPPQPPPKKKKKKSTVPTPQPHFPFYYVTSFTQYLLRGAYYEGKEYEGPNYLLSSLIDIQPIYKHGLHNQLHNKLLKISNNF